MDIQIPKPIKILLVDHERMYRTGLATTLRSCPDFSVDAADNSLDAVDKALALKPHVIFVDIEMPQCDLARIVSSIKEKIPGARVLVLTRSDKDNDVLGAVSAGADGYLLKGGEDIEIAQAARKAVAGELVFMPAISRRLAEAVRSGISLLKLSARESEILKMLGDGTSNIEIANRLFISESTVRTYVHRIMHKLNLNSRAEAVAYGARHYSNFSRITEGFKIFRTSTTPSHTQTQIAGAPKMHQPLPHDTFSAATEHALGHTQECATTEAQQLVRGERKQITALFTEVGSFRCVSRVLNQDEIDELMSRCHEIIREEIRRYDGIAAWFSGKGIMTMFGVPISSETSTQRALYAALNIKERLQDHARQLGKRGIEFAVHMGVNTGFAVVERIADGSTVEYKLVGNTSESAIEAQKIAEPNTIVVTENTYRLTKDRFDFMPLKEVSLGKDGKPIKFYKLASVLSAKSKAELALLRGLTRFVGREKEIAILLDCLDKARQGRGQVIGVVGGAGVGKSRLLLEFGNKLQNQTHVYLEGSCLYYGESIPYLPILNVLKQYFNIQEGEKEFSVKKKVTDTLSQLDKNLIGIVPPLLDILSCVTDDENYEKMEPAKKRGMIFDALNNLFVRLSQEKSLVLAIEDLQWIDQTSGEFLTYLIYGLCNNRIMLMLLYRPEYDHAWSGRPNYSHISLDELPMKSASELVRAILEGSEMVPELNEFILKKCGGNPLFIEELTRYLLDTGLIVRKRNRYMLVTTKSETLVPDTLQDIIASSIDSLDDKLKYTLQVASVIGSEFSTNILQMAGGFKENLSPVLQSLQGLGIIHVRKQFPEPEYVFNHALTQDVVYNSLTLNSRTKIHEKVGYAIEKIQVNRLDDVYELLAHHYSKSGNSEKAYHYLKYSAEKASRNYSNWESFRHYKETINILNKMEETEINKRKALDICLSMEGIMKVLGYPEDSLRILQEGERLASDLADNMSLMDLYSSIGLCYTFRGESARGLEYGQKCFGQAEKVQDIDMMATCCFDLCSSYAIRGEYLKTIKIAPRVIALMEKMHRENEALRGPYNFNLYAALSAYYGHALAILGYFKDGEALCEKALQHALAIDNVYTLGFVEVLYSLVLFCKGDAKGAGSHAQNALKCGEDAQVAPMLGMALCVLGWAHYIEGDLRVSLDLLDKGIRTQHDAGIHFLTSFHHLVLSEVYLQLGDLNRALVNAEVGFSLAEANNEKQFQGHSRVILGRAIAKGDKSKYQTAETNILQGIDILNEIGVKSLECLGYFYLGELYADMNWKERAIEYLNKAKGMFQEMGMDYWLRRAQELLATVQN